MGEQTEIWKPVVGYEGLYEVSNLGNVRSLDRTVVCSNGQTRNLKGKVLSKANGNNGYHLVLLYRDKQPKSWNVHVLVCEAFHGPRPPGYHAAHNDGDAGNSTALNLGWKLPVLNSKDRLNHGTRHGYKFKKLKVSDVKYIRERHKARCKRYGERALAKRFGVSLVTIHNVVARKTWANVS